MSSDDPKRIASTSAGSCDQASESTSAQLGPKINTTAPGCAEYRSDSGKPRCISAACLRCYPEYAEPQYPSYEAFRHVTVDKLRPVVEFWSPEHLEDGGTHNANTMGASNLKGNRSISMCWVHFCSCGMVFVADLAEVRAFLQAEPEVTRQDLADIITRTFADTRRLLATVGERLDEPQYTTRDVIARIDRMEEVLTRVLYGPGDAGR